ncbi:simukunin-like [Babylonia areolata]|uniref:simukunin-like n=1 Tax=Babylonia areolata TaxID=304850 RepID=UPI003FD00023
MATFNIVFAALFASVILVDFAVQARHCHPPCKSGERCVASNQRERRLRHNNVCVLARCLFRPRRGRCLNFQRRFHFDPLTMSCRRVHTGACYGRNNRFAARENCELTCAPRLRR